jgi:hypothetical protein
VVSSLICITRRNFVQGHLAQNNQYALFEGGPKAGGRGPGGQVRVLEVGDELLICIIQDRVLPAPAVALRAPPFSTQTTQYIMPRAARKFYYDILCFYTALLGSDLVVPSSLICITREVQCLSLKFCSRSFGSEQLICIIRRRAEGRRPRTGQSSSCTRGWW